MSDKHSTPYAAADGRQIVRVRRVGKQIVPGLTLTMYRLTHPFGRKSLTKSDFIGKALAIAEAKKRGWSFLNEP